MSNSALRYSGMARVNEGITQFYLPPTRICTSGMNHTCLYSPAAEHHRPLADTHFTVSRRVEGWVNLGGWLYTEMKCRPRKSNPDMVTHPSTNRAQRRLSCWSKPTRYRLQTATCLTDMLLFLSPKQNCQSSEWNSEHWNQLGTIICWPYHFLICQRTLEKEIISLPLCQVAGSSTSIVKGIPSNLLLFFRKVSLYTAQPTIGWTYDVIRTNRPTYSVNLYMSESVYVMFVTLILY